MNQSAFSIALLALFGHACVAEIAIETSQPEHLSHLHDAAVDILTTCFEDLGSAVAIVGDPDGSFLKTLRSKHFIPVVLINEKSQHPIEDPQFPHELQVFVVALDSVQVAYETMYALRFTVWWNQYANFLLIDTSPDPNRQCVHFQYYVYTALRYGVHNAQYICYQGPSEIWMINSNLFRRQAPPVWRWIAQSKLGVIETPINIFHRFYRKGGRVCDELNFPKTIDIGGYPLSFLTKHPLFVYDYDDPRNDVHLKRINASSHFRKIYESVTREKLWLKDNIARALNATAVLVQYGSEGFSGGYASFRIGIAVAGACFSSVTDFRKAPTRNKILPLRQLSWFAVTNHTAHKTQLDKILTVIDGSSRIGMWVVYLITFLFFKFFLGQAVTPALLNLVRLTCNTGLPTLPQELAPTLYLACLLMFVVNLQGIYTGNLATLLTTTIPYRNVETKQDIAHLGYTIYGSSDGIVKVSADPIFEGRFVEIPKSVDCVEYALRKPLAACVRHAHSSIGDATIYNLHISNEPMVDDYNLYLITRDNPLGRRLDVILKRFVECGLWYSDPTVERIRLQYVTDDEVKKNTDRRIMTLQDLGFCFTILGGGLLCAFICFIGEIVICTVRLKIAKRRKWARPRLARGVNGRSFLTFPSLNLRLNVRRVFSKGR